MKLTEYCKKYKNTWLWIFLFVCFCHGTMLLGCSIGIDTEELIRRRSDFYSNWLITGRQGLVFLKLLTDNETFNPYLAGALTLLFTTAACVLWTYLFAGITRKENHAGMLSFSFLLVSAAILTEQYYFRLQSMEISLGFCLTAVSLWLSWRFVTEKKWWGFVLAVLLMVETFSEYQAMAALYIFGAAACYFLYCFLRVYPEREAAQGKTLWAMAGRSVLVFGCGFAAAQLITALFFSGSDYLAGQVRWLGRPAALCWREIGTHMWDVLSGRSIYYSKYYPLYWGLLALCILRILAGGRAKKGKLPGAISVLFLFLAPFYLTFVCGAAPPVRSQLTLPFALAFVAYVLPMLPPFPGKYKKLWRSGLAVMAVLACYTQTRYTALLNYTDAVRYDSDVRTASSMIETIDALQTEAETFPVVFVGARGPQLNYACVVGETIGHSFFEWDALSEPYGYNGTGRILGFLHTMGGEYAQASREQTAAAVEYSRTMPDWPASGSVECYDGVIIVRLSEVP